MTKQDKLLAKLLKIPPPKDMTWDELELCFKQLGFAFRPSAGGGSHGRFVSEKDPTLFFCTCRPHPHPIVGAKTIKNRDCHEFCVHGIIGARYTGTPHEHDYQETNLS